MPSAVVFNHTVKAFIDHLLRAHGLLDEALTARLLGLGVDVRRPTDLEISSWWKMVELAAPLIAPGLPLAEAMEHVGREVVTGFSDTFLGQSAFLVLRVLGPRRALSRLTEQFRLADSVTHITSHEQSPTSVELTYQVDGGLPYPDYIRGLLLEGLRLVGARAPEVTATRTSPDTALFVVSWQRA